MAMGAGGTRARRLTRECLRLSGPCFAACQTSFVTDTVAPPFRQMSLGYWHALNKDGAVNVVSSSAYGGMGHSPTFSDNLVEVRLAGDW